MKNIIAINDIQREFDAQEFIRRAEGVDYYDPMTDDIIFITVNEYEILDNYLPLVKAFCRLSGDSEYGAYVGFNFTFKDANYMYCKFIYFNKCGVIKVFNPNVLINRQYFSGVKENSIYSANYYHGKCYLKKAYTTKEFETESLKRQTIVMEPYKIS